MPYKFEILLETTHSPNIIFNTEIENKQIFKPSKYKPLNKFSGWNECFNVNIAENLIELITKKIKHGK